MNILARVNRPVRCRLTEDLTRYHPGMTIGAEGTIDPADCLSRFGPNFVGVRLDQAGWQEIKWKGIEVLDDEWKEWEKVLKEKLVGQIKTAVDAGRILGPRGGFKEFYFTYRDSEGRPRRMVTAFEHEANEWEKELLKKGLRTQIVKLGATKR